MHFFKKNTAWTYKYPFTHTHPKTQETHQSSHVARPPPQKKINWYFSPICPPWNSLHVCDFSNTAYPWKQLPVNRSEFQSLNSVWRIKNPKTSVQARLKSSIWGPEIAKSRKSPNHWDRGLEDMVKIQNDEKIRAYLKTWTALSSSLGDEKIGNAASSSILFSFPWTWTKASIDKNHQVVLLSTLPSQILIHPGCNFWEYHIQNWHF